MTRFGFISVYMFGCLFDVVTKIKDISAKGSAKYVLFICHYFYIEFIVNLLIENDFLESFETYTNMLK